MQFSKIVCAYAAALIVLLVVGDARSARQVPGTITVGPNVQVSKALGSEPHYEIEIAADPGNAERLIANSMLWPSDHWNTEVVTYASLDGGKTWAPTLRTRGDAGYASWDPAVAYGPAGVAYSVSENLDADRKSYDRIDRSTDGGRTWAVASKTKHAERNFITVDTTGGERNGWIYLQGAGSNCAQGVKCLNPSAFYLQYSSDGGRTFSGQMVPCAEGNYQIGFGVGVVLSNGTFLMPMGEWKNYRLPNGETRVPVNVLDHDGRWANARLKVARVKFERSNWPLNVEVSEVGDWFMDRDWNRSMMSPMAVDATKGPFKDRAYVVWPDIGSGRSKILLSYSSDGGKTWSRPRVVNDDRGNVNGPGPDDIHGRVAVNPQGVVGVMWYDRRDHPDNLGWTVRFRASLDGGETFTPSVRVSEVPYLPDKTDPVPIEAGHGWGQINPETRMGVHSFNYSGGHTAGLVAAADGTFHPLWVGNSTGVPQVWTATLSVTGAAEKNGGRSLAEMTDVSGKTELRFTHRKFTRSSHLMEADVQIENLSEDTFKTPLKLRLLDLSSELGVPEIVNADDGRKGEGAVFDFTALVDGPELKPHGLTKPKHLAIRMVEIDRLRPFGSVAVFSMASFSTKVLTGSVSGPTKDSPTLKPRSPGESPGQNSDP